MSDNGLTSKTKAAIRAYQELDPDELRAFHYDIQHNDGHNQDNELPEHLSTWADVGDILGPISWAWNPWLVKGMLTILAGESGSGKSALALRLAACFLRGDNWPDKKPFTGELGAVLWCEAEAAQAINLERAKKWGLPLEKIYTPLDNPLDNLNLEIPAHRGALATKAMLPEVRFIVIDSLRGAQGGDENSSAQMELVKWLAALARDSSKPIQLTHHLRKRSIFDSEGVALERLRGSSAIVQAARLVWALDVPDPQAKNWVRLQVIKSNLAKFPEPLGLTIDSDGVKFGLAPEEPKTETIADKAADLLLAILAREPLTAAEIEEQVEAAGVSWRSAQRAKAKLGIVSIKRDDGHWYWSLPAKNENIN